MIGTGRNTARATAPAGVTYLDLDVTSDESIASLVQQVIDRLGHIDVWSTTPASAPPAPPRSSPSLRRRTSSTSTSMALCG
ncbi:short-Chain dehydrogenase [Arthrobacter sp. Hiyo4]|nr:short-Chain dehydrogenase [Arthrobacter sp. Hiyo4]